MPSQRVVATRSQPRQALHALFQRLSDLSQKELAWTARATEKFACRVTDARKNVRLGRWRSVRVSRPIMLYCNYAASPERLFRESRVSSEALKMGNLVRHRRRCRSRRASW